MIKRVFALISAAVLLLVAGCGGGAQEGTTAEEVSALTGPEDAFALQTTGEYKEKTCRFATDRALDSPYQGCYRSSVYGGIPTAIPGQPGQYKYREVCDQPYAGPDWLAHVLMNGFTQETSLVDQQPYYIMKSISDLKWNTSNVPVKSVVRTWGGYGVKYGYAVLPRVQYFEKSTGTWEYLYSDDRWSTLFVQRSNDNWTGPQDKIQIADQNGNGRGVYYFRDDHSELAVMTTHGFGTDGREYRQVWIEKTPGDHCQAKGTVLVP